MFWKEGAVAERRERGASRRPLPSAAGQRGPAEEGVLLLPPRCLEDKAAPMLKWPKKKSVYLT